MGYHVPVMAQAVVELVLGAPSGAFVDGTLGGGGHVAALVEAMAHAGEARPIIGIDKDPEALAAAAERLVNVGDFRAVHGDFRDLATLVRGERVAAILLDLGVSSRQLDAAERGFALKHPDAPLDMRMDPTRGTTALELVTSLDVPALARVLRDFGEVQDAHRIADRMKVAAANGQLATTGALARLIEREVSPKKTKHGLKSPATTVAQALRIAVNDELGALDQVLAAAPEVLVPHGRLLVMSYHSLEDRRVKHTFLAGERGPERPAKLPPPSDWRPTWQVLTRQAITADEAEVAANPRARSAHLRAAANMRGVVAAGAR